MTPNHPCFVLLSRDYYFLAGAGPLLVREIKNKANTAKQLPSKGCVTHEHKVPQSKSKTCHQKRKEKKQCSFANCRCFAGSKNMGTQS